MARKDRSEPDEEPEPDEVEPPAGGDDDVLEDDTQHSRTDRVRRFARRIMDRRDLAEDTKDLLYTVVSTSDKAKTEAVKMVAREVRNYLSELKLKEDLMHLATSYSLEISLSLKPLAAAAAADGAAPGDAAEDDGTEPDEDKG